MVTSQTAIIKTTRMLVVKQRSNVTGNGAELCSFITTHYILQLNILGTFPLLYVKNKILRTLTYINRSKCFKNKHKF